MLIGAMNHPRHDVVREIRWMADMGLEFVDLTLEPPAAASWQIPRRDIRAALTRHNLHVVGHTAYYLPISSAFEKVRRAAVAELVDCMEAFAALGAAWMNVHPDHEAPMQDRGQCISNNLRSLRELLAVGRKLGVGVMVENLPGRFNTPAELAELLGPLPALGLHLDIGHANLAAPRNLTAAILRAWGGRLQHVHLHDNRGGHADLHLALGAGTIDIPRHMRSLRAIGYEGTITLEVFTPDRAHLAYSVRRLREIWARAA